MPPKDRKAKEKKQPPPAIDESLSERLVEDRQEIFWWYEANHGSGAHFEIVAFLVACDPLLMLIANSWLKGGRRSVNTGVWGPNSATSPAINWYDSTNADTRSAHLSRYWNSIRGRNPSPQEEGFVLGSPALYNLIVDELYLGPHDLTRTPTPHEEKNIRAFRDSKTLLNPKKRTADDDALGEGSDKSNTSFNPRKRKNSRQSQSTELKKCPLCIEDCVCTYNWCPWPGCLSIIRRSEWKRHQNMHDPQSLWLCPLCSACKYRGDNLASHFGQKHVGEKSCLLIPLDRYKVPNFVALFPKTKCPCCGRGFDSFKEFINHIGELQKRQSKNHEDASMVKKRILDSASSASGESSGTHYQGKKYLCRQMTPPASGEEPSCQSQAVQDQSNTEEVSWADQMRLINAIIESELASDRHLYPWIDWSGPNEIDQEVYGLIDEPTDNLERTGEWMNIPEGWERDDPEPERRNRDVARSFDGGDASADALFNEFVNAGDASDGENQPVVNQAAPEPDNPYGDQYGID